MASVPEPRAAAARPPRGRHRREPNPWLVLGVLCLGFFMTLVDSTIVNVALPALGSGLHASLRDLLWVIDAYVLLFAVLLITAGRLGDRYGQKVLFLSGLTLFTLASAACGLAGTPAQLIGSRAAQGVGSAMLMPQTLSLITVVFPAESRGRAFGVWGTVVGLATLAGPLIGGGLLTHFSWRWVFFVNVPVGVAALLAATTVVPRARLTRRHRLDVAGLLLSAGGLFLITFGLIEGQYYRWGRVWGAVTISEIIVAGVVLLAAFLLVEWLGRAREPLVPFAIFADRNFAVMSLVMLGAGSALIGVFLPLTVFLQSVLGLSPLQAGLTLAPISLITLLVAPFAGRLADRAGKWVLFVGVGLFAAGIGTLPGALHPGMTRWGLAPLVVLGGLGLGMTFAPLQTLAMRNVPPRMAGAAAGVMNTARQLGGVVGSATIGALLQARLPAELASAAGNQVTGGRGQALPAPLASSVTAAFSGVQGDLQVRRVGAGVSAVDLQGVPPQFRSAVGSLARSILAEGFTEAARVALWAPLAITGIAWLSVLAARGQPRKTGRHRALGRRRRPGRPAASSASAPVPSVAPPRSPLSAPVPCVAPPRSPLSAPVPSMAPPVPRLGDPAQGPIVLAVGPARGGRSSTARAARSWRG